MILRGLIVVLAATTLVGCTNNTRPTQITQKKFDSGVQQMAKAHNAKVKDPNQKVVCERVVETGSRISHLRCRTLWQKKEQEKDAQDYLNAPKIFNTKCPPNC